VIVALLILILIALLFPKFLRFIFRLIALGLLYILVASAGHAGARSADCLLEIDEKRYIDGPCEFEVFPDSSGRRSFQIRRTDGGRLSYFAQVNVNTPGKADGYWNGELSATHAHDELGELAADGACWINDRAKVCAWKRGERRRLPAEASTPPTVVDDQRDIAALPRFPVDRNCAAHTPPYSPAHGFCVRQEQSRYDVLVMVWDQVPARDRDRCSSAAGRLSSGNYQHLFACVDAGLRQQELQRLRDPPPFRY
jgi:hypothetical protein